MASYDIGFIIGSLRNLMGMTMEELSGDFIDPSGISRIESGKRMPEKDKLEAIFQKLGVNPNNLIAIFSSEELTQRQKTTDTLDTCLFNRDVEGATKAINTLKQMANKNKIAKDKLFDRYMMAAEIANDINANKYDVTESIHALDKAMRLHYPKYDEKNIDQCFLTMTDFRILLMLGIMCFEQKDIKRAKHILFSLKNNIETKIIDSLERGRRYPIVIYNLAGMLIDLNEFKEAIGLCYLGRKICVATNSLELLPNIAIAEAEANIAIRNINEGIRLFLDACHTYRLYEKYDELEQVYDHVATKHNIKLNAMMKP